MSPRSQELNEKMRADTISKITNAAMESFAEKGFYGTTIKQIAKAIGLSYGLVYHYFPTKEKLFRHLIDISLEKAISSINPPLEIEGTAWEKINNLSTSLVNESLKDGAHLYFIIMIQALTQGKSIPGLLESFEKRAAKNYEKIIPVILQGQSDGTVIQGDPAVLAASYFAYVQGISLLLFQQEEIKGKITADMLNNLLKNR